MAELFGGRASGRGGTGSLFRSRATGRKTLSELYDEEGLDERKILYAILRASTKHNEETDELEWDEKKLTKNWKEYGDGISDDLLDNEGLSDLKAIIDENDKSAADHLKGWFGKAIDYADRPSQMILRGFDAAFERKDDGGPNVGLTDLEFGYGEIYREAGRGLKGQGQRINAREALDQPASVGGNVGWTADTALTILSDPITFLSGGGSAGLKGAGKNVAKSTARVTGKESAEQVVRGGFRELRDPVVRQAVTKDLAAQRIGGRTGLFTGGLAGHKAQRTALAGGAKLGDARRLRAATRTVKRAERLDKGGLRFMGKSIAGRGGRAQNFVGQTLGLADTRYLSVADPVALKKIDKEIDVAKKKVVDLLEEKGLGVGSEDALAHLNLEYLGAKANLDELITKKEALFAASRTPSNRISDLDLLLPGQRTDLARTGGISRLRGSLGKGFVKNADQNTVVREAMRMGKDISESQRHLHLKRTAEKLNKAMMTGGKKGTRRALRDMRRMSVEEKEEILRALDVGGDIDKALAGKALSKRGKQVLRALRDIRDADTLALKEAKILSEDQLFEMTDYLHRQLTDEARQLMGITPGIGTPPGGAASDLFGGGAFLSRNEMLAGKSVADINTPGTLSDAARAARKAGEDPTGLEGLGKFVDEGGKVYKDNPLDAIITHSGQVAGATSRVKYLDHLMDTINPDTSRKILSTTDEGGYIGIDAGTKIVDGQKVPTYYAPPELAKEIDETLVALTDDEVMKKWGQFMDGWMKTWKGYATVPVIFGTGFHARNAMGNMFNNYLAGATSLVGYRRAARLQALDDAAEKSFAAKMRPGLTPEQAYEAAAREIQSTGKTFGKLKELGRVTDDDIRILLEAKRRGIFGTGFFTEDLGKATQMSKTVRRNATDSLGQVGFRDAAKAKAKRVKDAIAHDSAPVRFGRKIGETVEGNARLGHFINQLDNGMDYAQAAYSVKKHLFDYGHLTTFEQKFMKRVIPFYTFMRNNVPLQMENVVTQPGKYTAMAHIQGQGAMIDPTEHTLPGWSQEQGMVPLTGDMTQALNQGVPNFLNLSEDQPTMIGFDTPIKAAFDAMEPLLVTAAFVANPIVGAATGETLADRGLIPEDHNMEDIAEAWLGLPGGGPIEMLSFLLETDAGVDSFTGSEAIRTESSADTRERFASALSPIVGKGFATYRKATDEEKRAELLYRNVLGLNVSEVTEGRQQGARKGRLADLEILIRKMNDGLDETTIDPVTGDEIDNPRRVPTVADLQEAGILRDIERREGNLFEN